MAGIGPEDVSAAEVHDATAMGEIVQVDNLGFCALGDGGPISARGETQIGGRIPVNPSGGLESKGHPMDEPRMVDQPNVNAKASTPGLRNSISNWRSVTGCD